MSETIEHAREGIEHAAHAHEHGDVAARWVAVLVAVLAAMLAIGEFIEKDAMVTWLASHISVSDDYAFYQAKSIRSVVLDDEANTLTNLPNHADPAVQARITAARKEIAKLKDAPGDNGMKQLLAKAGSDGLTRDQAEFLTHEMELVVGGLQIAIVLASVSIVTRVHWLAWGGFGLGVLMALYGVVVWVGTL